MELFGIIRRLTGCPITPSAGSSKTERETYGWVPTAEAWCAFRVACFVAYGKYSGLPEKNVKSIAQDETGYLLGTHGGGLARLEGDRIHRHPHGDAPPSWILTVCGDRNGNRLGRCFRGRSLQKFVERGLERYDLGFDGKVSVHALQDDSSGGLWVGTSVGLFHVDGPDVQHWGRDEGLTGLSVRAFAEDPAGKLWLGTYDDGLFRFSDNQFERYGPEHGVGSSQIRSLHVDPDGTVWIGTFG